MAFSLDLLAGVLWPASAHAWRPSRIKLVLQTQDSNVAILSGKHRHYKGFLDTLGTMVKEEGFWSLWRGNLTSVVRYMPPCLSTSLSRSVPTARPLPTPVSPSMSILSHLQSAFPSQ